ncbi:hypothetical protein [Cytobacillus sp. IB215316]|uniref:hypothetical protein n=1 Tax=Cytobacillus sp. IB215316 TaxID=3097354 RepID=UPI002A121C93|nr:hypothetical protein [Cytobacillus sp. IB215316]MDX8362429.1 hypothetical protein [Cytobacillus sp. IB215316]
MDEKFEKKFQSLFDNDDILCDDCLKLTIWAEIEASPDEVIAKILEDDEYYYICEYCKGYNGEDIEFWRDWVDQQRTGEPYKNLSSFRKRFVEEAKRRREIIIEDEYWMEFKEWHKKIKEEFRKKGV